MNGKFYAWVSALFLSPWAIVSAQTPDALVVDDNGRVGVVLIAPNESLEVTAVLAPPFADLPRRCQRGVPVKIVISDAESGIVLIDERQMLSETRRIFIAKLPADANDDNSTRVQVGVMTAARLTRCIGSSMDAINDKAIRRIEPDRISLK